MNSKNNRSVMRTKTKLRDGLIALIMQKPIKDITVRELTELVDLNRGTFYLHYRDIYDMIEQLELEIEQDVNLILDEHPPEACPDNPGPIATAFFEYLTEHASLCQALLSPNGDRAFVEQIKVLIENRFLQHIKETGNQVWGEFSGLYVSYIISGCLGMLEHWLNTGMKQSPIELAKIVETSIMRSKQLWPYPENGQ